MSLYGCHTRTPRPHPWDARIDDCACGYDERLADPHCQCCRRSRDESPLDQLAALDGRHDEDGIRK